MTDDKASQVVVPPDIMAKINEAASNIRILWWGDIVKPEDHNAYVDWLKGVHEAFNIPNFEPYLEKLRYVTKDDIICSADFNNVVEALKVAVPYIIELHDEVFAESEVYQRYREDALNALETLEPVSPEQPVGHAEWNKRAVAALKVHAVVAKEFLKVELPASIDLIYSLADKPISIENVISAVGETTTVIIEPAAAAIVATGEVTTSVVEPTQALIFAAGEATTEAVEIVSEVTATVESTITALSLNAIVSTSYDFPTVLSLNLPISTTYDFPYVRSQVLSVLLSFDFPKVVSLENIIETTYDFPTLFTECLSITLSYDFPDFISTYLTVELAYDFPEFISEALTISLCHSEWLDLIHNILEIRTTHDTWIDIVSRPLVISISEYLLFTEVTSEDVRIDTSNNTTVESATLSIAINAKGDVALAIGADVFISLAVEQFTTILEKLITAVSATFDLSTSVVESQFLIRTDVDQNTESHNLDSMINLVTDSTYATKDIQPKVDTEVATDISPKDIVTEAVKLINESTYVTRDLIPVISLVLEKSLESGDLIIPITTAIEKFTETFDLTSCIITAMLDLQDALASLDLPRCTIETSYETKITYWYDLGWKYRRRLIVTNNVADIRNYQLAIILTPDKFDYSKAKPDGSDIRVADEDGVTILPYWIERWEYGGVSVIWVLVTRLPVGEKWLWLYYGNPDAEYEGNPYEVFDWFDDLSSRNFSIYFGGGMNNVKLIKS